ncbi:energy transducer TonB [Maribacter sp. PR1]|uniref:Energy transducer TonB n=1 Tax=Maribacter cobaltidurans TaxID=1178778 RepID=A0ABU7IRI3_9FLAO|nr:MULTISPECIES: energy transducer TonB [Maribacter]MDC6388188.1 energy transducer TonB [Maribacter sp. PR1]MEE1975576.1 energy transducer TonB [Maribacter cobaltidurans]
MNLNRQQLSLLITFFSMGIVVLVLYNIHLGAQQEDDDDYVVEMVLEDLPEELTEEEEELLEELSKTEAIKSHMAFNETAKPSYGNPEPLQTLEEIMEERAMENEGEIAENLLSDADFVQRVKELAKKREEKKQMLGEKEAQKQEYTNNLAERRTSISFSLVDRNGYRLPPPIYTCIEGGKVVVNIEVDNLGNVIDASFNEKSSGTSNGCLVDNALAYAYKAQFSTSDRSSQKGTITYLFQGK